MPMRSESMPSRVNITQLRNNGRSSRRGQTTRPKKIRYLDRYTLPKWFTFICVPENGSDGPPRMPKKTGFDQTIYNAMDRQRMILDIRFDEGDHEYCSQKVLQEFAHLSLGGFQFYRGGSSNNLTAVQHIRYDHFDLANLVQ
jgi:hypothetical protein